MIDVFEPVMRRRVTLAERAAWIFLAMSAIVAPVLVLVIYLAPALLFRGLLWLLLRATQGIGQT